eukprot:3451249-Pleurochrysis_carterae.AAC.1
MGRVRTHFDVIASTTAVSSPSVALLVATVVCAASRHRHGGQLVLPDRRCGGDAADEQGQGRGARLRAEGERGVGAN